MVVEVAGKVVLITGAASGIGAELAKEFLKQGAKHVGILDINEEAGKLLEEEQNGKHGLNKARFFRCDVTNETEFVNAFDSIFKDQGCVDVVVNNAGIMNDHKTAYKKEIEVNVTALISGTLKAYEAMRKDKGGCGGSVINISSIAGITKTALIPIYFATKAAVVQFGQCIGMKNVFERSGVRVLTVCFGATHTPLLSNSQPFDDFFEERDMCKTIFENLYVQKPESAVRGVLEAFKNGDSGSTWLADSDNLPVDITKDISDGYSVMARSLTQLSK